MRDVAAGLFMIFALVGTSVLGHINAGRLKALGVASPNRATALPDVPTIAEAGDLSVFDMRGWIGLLAPAAMALDLRVRLAQETRKILQTAEIKERFTTLGIEPGGQMPDEFAEYLRKQSELYGAIVKQVNLKAD